MGLQGCSASLRPWAKDNSVRCGAKGERSAARGSQPWLSAPAERLASVREGSGHHAGGREAKGGDAHWEGTMYYMCTLMTKMPPPKAGLAA